MLPTSLESGMKNFMREFTRWVFDITVLGILLGMLGIILTCISVIVGDLP